MKKYIRLPEIVAAMIHSESGKWIPYSCRRCRRSLVGGERQRIAIARAVLKNAPIVILDEATAYIDAENEALIQEAMAKVIAGKTVLMIAHRLSTITDADKIVVIKDGQIIDEGTHENLLTSCTLYQEMWKAHMDTKDVA